MWFFGVVHPLRRAPGWPAYREICRYQFQEHEWQLVVSCEKKAKVFACLFFGTNSQKRGGGLSLDSEEAEISSTIFDGCSSLSDSGALYCHAELLSTLSFVCFHSCTSLTHSLSFLIKNSEGCRAKIYQTTVSGSIGEDETSYVYYDYGSDEANEDELNVTSNSVPIGVITWSLTITTKIEGNYLNVFNNTADQLCTAHTSNEYFFKSNFIKNTQKSNSVLFSVESAHKRSITVSHSVFIDNEYSTFVSAHSTVTASIFNNSFYNCGFTTNDVLMPETYAFEVKQCLVITKYFLKRI